MANIVKCKNCGSDVSIKTQKPDYIRECSNCKPLCLATIKMTMEFIDGRDDKVSEVVGYTPEIIQEVN